MISNPLFNNPFEASIQQLLRLEGRKKVQLQGEQKQLQTQQKALTDIDSKLSSLNTLLTSFTESPDENIKPLSGTSTDPDAVEIISTSGIKNPGSYSIDVNRLAKEDIVLSDAFANNGTDISASGNGSFQISIGDDNPVNINIDTEGLSNLKSLEAIADEVNDQLGEKVTASVFKLGDGTSRLSFKSVESGEASRININNEGGDFGALNLTNEYAAGELNAQFTIDNVTFERSSNLITDAIEGFSFELNKTTDSTEQLKIARNLEDARANIDDFIKKFNEANSIIREKTFLNGETGNRGPLQNERSVRNLSFSLRQAASLPVDSLAGSGVNTLSSIGIDVERDGTLKVDDSAALDEALTENPQAVADLFSADDGIAAALNQRIDQYISDDSGVFKSIESGIDGRLDRLDDRIQNEDERLVQEEESLRAEFAELQQIIDQGQRQFNNAVNFQSSLGF
jgi:flagellar hook-associated protein 2